MDRKFLIIVSDNKDSDGNRTGATWVTLMEQNPKMPEVEGYQFRPWYTDYVVRPSDVKKIVKNHLDFLKSFDVSKDNIHIDDQRGNVRKPEEDDGQATDPGQHGAQQTS